MELLKNKSVTFLWPAMSRVILFLHSSIAISNNREHLAAVFKYCLQSRKEYLSKHFAENHMTMTYGCKIMVSLTLCRFFWPPCIYTFFDRPTGQTARQFFTHDGSDDAVSRKDVLFRSRKFKVNIYPLKNPPNPKTGPKQTKIFGRKHCCIKFSPINGLQSLP